MESTQSKLHKKMKSFNIRERVKSETYYASWKGKEHRFGEPIPYDSSFPVRFPNIVLEVRSLEEAKAKIEAINNKAKGIDRFNFKRKGVL